MAVCFNLGQPRQMPPAVATNFSRARDMFGGFMTIRTKIVPLIGALLAVSVAGPCLADAELAPHTLELEKSIEPDGLVIQDLSGGVGSQDATSGGGGVLQIMQIQPSTGNGASTSSSAPRYVSTPSRSR
jgi:hypothetical protein